MKKSKLSDLSDQELLNEALKDKSITTAINALLLGFCFGVIIYSMLNNSVGLFTLIPLFFAFKLINNSQRKQEIKTLIKERKLD